MENKERFDAFMRLAEFQQVSLERRIGIEWKMTTVLWTAIFLGTSYLKSNGINLPHYTWIFITCFLIIYFFWLGLLGRANFIDKSFKEYYRNEAEQALDISTHKIEHPDVRRKLYWGAWLLLEYILTALFLVAAYILLNCKTQN